MFKSLLISLFAIFLAANVVTAQEMVSTDPQPRNVILEEFTGIHCGWCPAGHKISNELAAQYPGKFIPVNLHTGGYATPNAGELDLRTSEGATIAGASGLTGYPAGSVNRDKTPWAMGRGEWAAEAARIMAETSPVNVAVKSDVNWDTRELTTVVEYYYTSASPQPENKLTVMLVQNNILGTQSGGANLYPENMTADGLYRHLHVFRMMISEGGAFGEPISTTTEGHFGTKTFTTQLPEAITNIDLKLFNLEVVAFVAEGQSKIYSGAAAMVTIPDEYYQDFAIENMSEMPTSWCFNSIHPQVKVTNNSGMEITSFDITLNIDGVDNVKSFTGSLNKGDNTVVDWGEMDYSPKGGYSIAITGISNVNEGVEFNDMNSTNDVVRMSGIGFTGKAVTMMRFGFDDQSSFENIAFDNSENAGFSVISSSTAAIGANNSYNTIRFSLHNSWGLAGKPGHIIMGGVDVGSLVNKSLTYYYAYSDGSLGGTAPTIKVAVSEDCGDTWTDISTITCEETGQPSNPQNYYVPATSEYKGVDVNLANYDGKDILVRVSGIPGTSGNALYVDDISIGFEPLGVEEETFVSDEMIYPNPAENEIFFNNDMLLGHNYEVYSLLGDVVLSGVNTGNSIDISSLTTGTYVVKINNNFFRIIKK